jgi:aldose 1-epimerase
MLRGRGISAVAGVVMVIIATIVSAQLGGASSKMQKQSFGKTSDGQEVDLYTLSNARGMQVAISNYGGEIVTLKVPDRNGKSDDVVFGYDNIAGYEVNKAYFGATIGRYGNRIAKGKFSLDGHEYQLPLNDGPNTLHGGTVGFNRRVFTAKEVASKGGEALELDYLSKDGEEGFPGNLSVKVVFTLPAENNELKIEYSATTDKATVLNLTNHSYFALAGEGATTMLDEELTLNAKQFLPVDATLIPTGVLRSVSGTPFDFTQPTVIGKRIDDAGDEQLKFGKGYDHNWVLEGGVKSSPAFAARVYDPKSGRVLEILTTEPGIQFYSGNFLDGTVAGKGGKLYAHRSALALETQHYPDSPNQPSFPSTELKPGKTYHSISVYRFSVK